MSEILIPGEEVIGLVSSYREISHKIDTHSRQLLALKIEKEEIQSKLIDITYSGIKGYLKKEHIDSV